MMALPASGDWRNWATDDWEDEMSTDLRRCQALTFDVFGTVLDLRGSLESHIAAFLNSLGSDLPSDQFWEQWRYRQRIEQYQDSLMMAGHSGYLATARRACVYVSRLNDLAPADDEIDRLMGGWRELSPFAECVAALERLRSDFKLVALSNGDASFLDHLVTNRIGFDFSEVLSVDAVGAFKPHPAVYRHAVAVLALEPSEVLMVSANSFDVMGARSCGLRGAYVNRSGLPYEDTPHTPDLTVADFTELADALLSDER